MVNTGLTNQYLRAAEPPRVSARRAFLLRRKERIENQLAAMDARVRISRRKRDTRRKIIVGAAVLAHARLDPVFADHLSDVLNRAIVRPRDRLLVAGQRVLWRSAAREALRSGRSSTLG